ncbi:hypothetical protein AV530_008205 [Patagioenas fasciata monilis]|uniref:Uncharacterized protein n=1 Tax=Patagioenas fasciata monilis TaxID=372326 RepID=A0A1V4KUV9_PATFA|nr:hypothetical protein AV530_008205 [Patagioenas fasciata monilis]
MSEGSPTCTGQQDQLLTSFSLYLFTDHPKVHLTSGRTNKEPRTCRSSMGSGAVILPLLCQRCPSQLPQLHYMMLVLLLIHSASNDNPMFIT